MIFCCASKDDIPPVQESDEDDIWLWDIIEELIQELKQLTRPDTEEQNTRAVKRSLRLQRSKLKKRALMKKEQNERKERLEKARKSKKMNNEQT